MATRPTTKPLAKAIPFVFGEFGKPLAPRHDDAPRPRAIVAAASAAASAAVAIVAPVAKLSTYAKTLIRADTPPAPSASGEAQKSLSSLAAELRTLVQRDRQSRAKCIR